MGACFTKTKEKPAGNNSADSGRVPDSGRDAYPEPEEDDEEQEKVKEVLSETPRPRLSHAIEDAKNEPAFQKTETPEPPPEIPSFFAAEKRGGADEATELRRRREGRPSPAAKFQRNRSLSGELPSCRRGRCAAASAAGGGGSARSSPARRQEGGARRARPAGEAGQAARSRVPVLCRDPGERSGRRSVSPAAAPVMEHRRCLSAAARTNAPRRIPAAPSGGGGSSRRGPGNEEDGSGYDYYSGGKESLENPLVSLECFIFL